MTALAAVALLAIAALLSPRLRQQHVAPASAPRTLTADAILATAAAKLREANVVVQLPSRSR
jgi:hypothetical protein